MTLCLISGLSSKSLVVIGILWLTTAHSKSIESRQTVKYELRSESNRIRVVRQAGNVNENQTEPTAGVIFVPDPKDPGNCMNTQCDDAKEACVLDYFSPEFYKCKWAFNNISDPSSPQTEILPGHCDGIANPPSFGADGSDHMCKSDETAMATKFHRCVCIHKSCPPEDLKSCEKDYLANLAMNKIIQTIQASEKVNKGDECNFELDQMVPQFIEDFHGDGDGDGNDNGNKSNLYRMVKLLGDALKDKPFKMCNRRRLMTCRGGKCDCAEGTEQREIRAPSGTYFSYYCYPISGSCVKDPAKIIPQFRELRGLVRNHYGDPLIDSHLDPNSGGCLYNLCKNVRGRECVS